MKQVGSVFFSFYHYVFVLRAVLLVSGNVGRKQNVGGLKCGRAADYYFMPTRTERPHVVTDPLSVRHHRPLGLPTA